ncbi:MAG: YHYH protein [Akkermansiaceae bacterium]
MKSLLALLTLLAQGTTLADPRINSWFTEDSGRYARIYSSAAAETAGTTSTVWSKGAGIQSAPTYAGVSKVVYSANWVYIKTTGLAGHIMGPWPDNFPNFPSNRAKTYRIPRTPAIPVNKTLTGLGATGAMVNGVSMFDMRDAFSYVSASGTDATPGNGLTGDGIWNREAYHNESITFDPALAHQAGNNYHYHAQPIALRYQLGDHVDYNPVTNRYTEKTTAVSRHSPIVAWAADGLPVYGPYGYSSPLDSTSGLRRMESGFVLRDGSNGTTNLALTGRTSLPAWAQRIQTNALKNGPAVSASHLLGHYIEDFDYLGDQGFTVGVDFDLNEQNVRWCLTPEFPSGTYAYFTTLKLGGTPAYPYTTGRQYFGSPTGGTATINETVTIHFDGGPNKSEKSGQVVVDDASGDVTLTWSAVEGGTYRVEASSNLNDWPDIAPGVVATSDSVAIIETGAKTAHSSRFYRVSRTSLAAFDTVGFDYTPADSGTTLDSVAPGGSAARGSTVTVTITLPSSPPNPPAHIVPITITLGGISGTSISRPGATTAEATFIIPANSPLGAQTVVVTFSSPGPTYTLTGAFSVN